MTKRPRLSPEQAFAAMAIFLDRYRDRSSGGDLRALLGDIQINDQDGLPFDSAAWSDWLEAVGQALEEKSRVVEAASAR